MEKGSAMKALILANGAFPVREKLLLELKEAEFLAVCDGGVCHLEHLDIEPDVIIGDLDSITKELKEKYSQKIIHIKEQESNDLSKAFFHCVNLGYDEFTILGATGKREDHTIANISLLSVYINYCKSVVMKSDFGTFSVYKTPCQIPSQEGEQISIFTPNPQTILTSKGLKYPLNHLALPLWANGTLNEALGESFSLDSENEGECVILYHSFLK